MLSWSSRRRLPPTPRRRGPPQAGRDRGRSARIGADEDEELEEQPKRAAVEDEVGVVDDEDDADGDNDDDDGAIAVPSKEDKGKAEQNVEVRGMTMVTTTG